MDIKKIISEEIERLNSNNDVFFKINEDEKNSCPWDEVYNIDMYESTSKIKIGRLIIRLIEKKNRAEVFRSEVIEDFRGKGYGKKLYLKAKEFANSRNYNLYGDKIQSQDALNMWDSFKKTGLSKIDNDGIPYLEEDIPPSQQ